MNVNRASTMPSSELTAELQRVFSMLGGSTHKPVLDANTVALVLSQLGGSAAPEQEVQQVMAALRAGPDNVITYAQFEAALCEWLEASKQSTSTSTSTSSPSDARKRKGKSRGSDEHCSSRRVLTGVSSFFTQFRPRQEVKLEDLEDSDDDTADGSSTAVTSRVTAKDKIELLHYISRTLAAFPALVDAARSANLATVCEAVATLERALQVHTYDC
jgi:hypothetical protein